jgi:hypothetical protein
LLQGDQNNFYIAEVKYIHRLLRCLAELRFRSSVGGTAVNYKGFVDWVVSVMGLNKINVLFYFINKSFHYINKTAIP